MKISLDTKLAVFLDRDGTLNLRPQELHYTMTLSELKDRIFPSSQLHIANLKGMGYKVIVITNQPGVGDGTIPSSEYALMVDYLYKLGVDDVYTCPHPEFNSGCDCRKPQPGMLIAASHKWGLDLSKSWVVGDSDSDILAGRNAGCRTFKGTLEEFMVYLSNGGKIKCYNADYSVV